MARASGLGLVADLGKAPVSGPIDWEGRLLGESTGRFLLAVEPASLDRLRAALAAVPHAVVGAFDPGDRLRIGLGAAPLLDAPVGDLASAWKHTGRAS